MANERRSLNLRAPAMVASLPDAVRSLVADRAELHRLARAQGALRHVAMLVARGISPPEAFRAIAAELGTLVRADCTAISRYEADPSATVVAHWSDPESPDVITRLGGRWPIGTDTAAAAVRRTGQPERRRCEHISGEIGQWARSYGIGHIISCPVWVEGRLWGEVAVMFRGDSPPPRRTEERLNDFVELVACTIAQAKSRADLIDSRSRVIAASDATRRRIERDLHDGVQQHLTSINYDVRAAVSAVRPDQAELKRQLSSTAEDLSVVLTELQEIARGLHPAVLSKSGLDAALKMLARRSPVPVDLQANLSGPLPEQVEVTIYYIVCEALTNVLKHANASKVHVDLSRADGEIHLSVSDDGLGGATLGHGSGLMGLSDRVDALEGTMAVVSPAGEGTSLHITIPVKPHP
ncbi:MAG TPA: GAF domain-containing sensor histidine kinase [Actinoallomurus sp.]